MNVNVGVKLIHEDARLPQHQHEGDAGADLYVYLDEKDRKEGITIFPDNRALIATGIHVVLPEGFWARITHRSSTEKRLRLRVVEGTIDQGYTGPLFVQVHNGNTFPITVQHGDRLAQLILCPIIQGNFKVVDNLPATDRGAGGFGSTGGGGSL